MPLMMTSAPHLRSTARSRQSTSSWTEKQVDREGLRLSKCRKVQKMRLNMSMAKSLLVARLPSTKRVLAHHVAVVAVVVVADAVVTAAVAATVVVAVAAAAAIVVATVAVVVEAAIVADATKAPCYI
jgi:hypothetical protein